MQHRSHQRDRAVHFRKIIIIIIDGQKQIQSLHFSGADGGFCDKGRLKIIVYSGNMGAHFSREFRAHAPPEKFLRLNFSEMQSSAFWTLKFSKCLVSY